MNPVDLSVYAIFDPEHSRGREPGKAARIAVEHGATLLQLRAKKAAEGDIARMARDMLAAIAPTQVPLLINDHPAIANTVGAHGVHLGQDDMNVAAARALLGPQAIIGLSIKTIAEAQAAPVEVIDYACIGGVFDTASKDNPAAIGIAGFAERLAVLQKRVPGMPVGAIAGIDAQNAGSLVAAGADGVAVISAIFMADDIGEATASLADSVTRARRQ